jgi:hypothetical protein
MTDAPPPPSVEPSRSRRGRLGSLRLGSFGARLVAIAIGGVGVRLVYIAVIGPKLKPGLDTTFYMLTGQILSATHHYRDPAAFFAGRSVPTANFPPLYPILIAALDRIGVTSFRGLEVVGALCGGATVLLTGGLARAVTHRSGPALLAAALVAVSPALIAADASVMAESIGVPLAVGALLAAAWAARSGGLVRWALPGALGGLCALARTEALLLVVVLVPVVALVAPGTGWRLRLGAAGVAVVTAAVVLTPWLVRNETEFHPGIAFSTNEAKTLAGANCAPVYGGPSVGLWDFDCLDQGARTALSQGRLTQVLAAQGTDYARAHPERVPAVVAVRILRAWGLYDPVQQARWQAVESRDAGWGEAVWPATLLLLIVAVPGILRMRRDKVALVLLAGPPLLATVTVALSYGNQRFVLDALPVLCVAAAVALVQWWEELVVHRPRHDGGGGRPQG